MRMWVLVQICDATSYMGGFCDADYDDCVLPELGIGQTSNIASFRMYVCLVVRIWDGVGR